MIYLENENYDEAINWFKAALDADPNYLKAQQNLDYAQKKKGE